MKLYVFGFLLPLLFSCASFADEVARPNVLWIIVDDMSADFACYGETRVDTPNVDRLASEGVQFNRAFVTAPVCSTCRSAFITGMYQTSIGAHHHRSGRGEATVELPADVEPIPAWFQRAGYHTSISGWPNKKGKLGKTDYNFEWDKSIYDSSRWDDRKPGQPFFAQIHTPGGKLRGGTRESAQRLQQRAEAAFGSATDPNRVVLPPYYPRDETLLEDWAAYLDSVRFTDQMVGEVVQKLKDDGDYDNTILIFMTDHGISHARGKQFLYDEGLHVPLVIRGPGLTAGRQRNDLVEHIDIAATSLGLAGIDVPTWMQSKNVMAADYQRRKAVFAARDRCDETVDHIRSVRTERFKYIRNFLPERPYLQPNAYKDKKSILIALRRLHQESSLNAIQEQLFAKTRPAEELYDLRNDPHEIHNLAADPKHAAILADLRSLLDRWMAETKDQGRQSESKEMFDSDMAIYLKTLRIRQADPAHIRTVEQNIALMREWAAAGK